MLLPVLVFDWCFVVVVVFSSFVSLSVVRFSFFMYYISIVSALVLSLFIHCIFLFFFFYWRGKGGGGVGWVREFLGGWGFSLLIFNLFFFFFLLLFLVFPFFSVIDDNTCKQKCYQAIKPHAGKGKNIGMNHEAIKLKPIKAAVLPRACVDQGENTMPKG